MKVVIFLCNLKFYFICWLVEVGEVCGYEVRVIDILCCYMNMVIYKFIIYYKGKFLEDFDVVVFRVGVLIIFYGIVVVCQFEMMGVYFVNELVVIFCFWDKLCLL